MNMNFLLQVPIELPRHNANSLLVGLVFILIFVAVIVAIIRFSATNNPAGREKFQGSRARVTGPVRRYSRWMFRSMAANAGLSREQAKILERLIHVYRVSQPFLLFSNARLLDNLIKKNIYSVTQNVNIPVKEKENRIGQLFRIKQQIEHTSRKGIGITSTSLIRPAQTLVLTFTDGKQFRTEVTNNYRSRIACLLPQTDDIFQDKKRWQKGIKVKVLFWRENDSGYTFFSRILGTAREEGEKIIYLKHAQSLKRNQQRKFRRRPFGRKCLYYPLEVVMTGKGYQTAKKVMIKTDERATGIIHDIGAGGCSIQCQTPVEKSQYLKIVFTFNLDELALYGRVIRITKREDEEEPIMHVMFTRVTGHDRNQIYQYVYNYI